MERNYSDFEIEHLDAIVKRQIEQAVAQHSAYAVVGYALQCWADRIEAMPKRMRNSHKIESWIGAIKRRCDELDAALHSDGPERL